jgi:hypothetical protein
MSILCPNSAFKGTATALKNGGPIGLLLGYIAVGTICYSVMVGSRVSFYVPCFIFYTDGLLVVHEIVARDFI